MYETVSICMDKLLRFEGLPRGLNVITGFKSRYEVRHVKQVGKLWLAIWRVYVFKNVALLDTFFNNL